MSIKTETRDEEFRTWKRELLARADDWSKKHPEPLPVVTRPLPPTINPTNPYNKAFVMPSLVVKVTESPVNRNIWNVFKNNVLIESFSGPLAHAEASRLASKILDRDEGTTQSLNRNASLSSPMCIFCGGRYSHRTDCPDLKKDGPQME